MADGQSLSLDGHPSRRQRLEQEVRDTLVEQVDVVDLPAPPPPRFDTRCSGARSRLGSTPLVAIETHVRAPTQG